VLRVRRYGTTGPWVVLIHGGPGVAGYMAPLGRELADEFRLLEPFQRGSSGERLTVARHVGDLADTILEHCGSELPALVGSSWGAMLALAFAAEHPDRVGPLVLVGCGTFDAESRAVFRSTLLRRLAGPAAAEIARLRSAVEDPDTRLRALGALMLPAYSHDLLPHDDETDTVDALALEETWADMLRRQREGIFPTTLASIRTPVLMLHGDTDPHPGQRIRDGLRPVLPGLEYRELARCGHYPWLEREARDVFFAELRAWLREHAPRSGR